ncbi:S-adenosyl-L-methionine-dependent methyltransferases superfamily protein [Euphorbia peplus]|nr:S-adenosyl-L-methionine-dependent methyltransferases superfamily protein [Euphorbia peplus]
MAEERREQSRNFNGCQWQWWWAAAINTLVPPQEDVDWVKDQIRLERDDLSLMAAFRYELPSQGLLYCFYEGKKWTSPNLVQELYMI